MTGKHSKNGKMIKVVSLAAAGVIVAGSISVMAYAAAKNNSDTGATTTSGSEDVVKTENSEVSKDETVYVLANADGSVKKIIVSDWIKNGLDAKKITDTTELKDVTNVKGDESYTMDSDNARVWDADGNDIYCQGTIEKALPVDLSVTYKLDGKNISAEDLAGKSGKVTMRFDYKNNQYENVTIDGKTEKIYVPFIMLTGMLLDNDTFKNVEVTNGKVINDGSRIAVMGFALPGLQGNLALSKDKIDIPDYVEITADVKDFAITTTMTLATNSVFNEVDTSKLDSVDGLKDQIGTLTSSMAQLLDGSSQLYSNLNLLMGKSGELVAGINKLNDGAGKLTTGSASLNAGLKQLVSNNDNINGGAKQVFDTLLSTVETQIKESGITVDTLTIENYKTVLNNLITNPTDAQKGQLVQSANTTLETQLSANEKLNGYHDAIKVMLCDKMTAGMTQEAAMAEITTQLTDTAVVKQIKQTYSIAGNSAEDTQKLMQYLCGYLQKQNQNPAGDYSAEAQTMLVNAGVVQAAATDANAQTKINGLCFKLASATLTPTVEGAIKQLDTYNEFYQGVLTYTAGVKTAYDGSTELNSGIGEIAGGIGQLNSKSGALVSGVQQLTDGSKKLADGLNQFNEQGISKIAALAGDDLTGAVTRLKATVDISKKYKSFAGIGDDEDGNVKFIYKTDEIKK